FAALADQLVDRWHEALHLFKLLYRPQSRAIRVATIGHPSNDKGPGGRVDLLARESIGNVQLCLPWRMRNRFSNRKAPIHGPQGRRAYIGAWIAGQARRRALPGRRVEPSGRYHHPAAPHRARQAPDLAISRLLMVEEAPPTR